MDDSLYAVVYIRPPAVSARRVACRQPATLACIAVGTSVAGTVLELRPAPDLERLRAAVQRAELEYAVRWGAVPAVHVGAVPTAPAPGLVQIVVLGASSEHFADFLLTNIHDSSMTHRVGNVNCLFSHWLKPLSLLTGS